MTKRMGGLVLRESPNFRLLEKRGRFYLEALEQGAIPRVVRIAKKNISYLEPLKRSDFDVACVWDFGCGVHKS